MAHWYFPYLSYPNVFFIFLDFFLLVIMMTHRKFACMMLCSSIHFIIHFKTFNSDLSECWKVYKIKWFKLLSLVVKMQWKEYLENKYFDTSSPISFSGPMKIYLYLKKIGFKIRLHKIRRGYRIKMLIFCRNLCVTSSRGCELYHRV